MPFKRPDTRIDLLALGLLVLVTGIFFRGVLRGESLYAGEFHETTQPLAATLGEAARGGSWSWNGQLSNGVPLVADPLQAALYPPSRLAAIPPVEAALTVSAVLHALLGAAGAWFLGRQLGLRPLGAWTAALVFAFNGVSASATAHPHLGWSHGWLPWLLLAWEAVRSTTGRRRLSWVVALGGVTLCLFLLAEPFALGAGALGLAILTLDDVGRRGGPRRDRRDAAGWLPPLVGLGLGVLLAAPFLIAVWNYWPSSTRGVGFTPGSATQGSLHPLLAFGMLLPGVFGDASLEGLHRFWPRALSPDRDLPAFAGLYVGSLAIWLTMLGLRRSWDRRVGMAVWLGLLILLALGRYGPVYPLLELLGPLDALRTPLKWLLSAMLPLALLAGSGLDALAARHETPGIFRRLISLLALAAVLGLVSLAASPGLDDWLVSLVHGPGEEGGVGMGTRLVVQGFVLRSAMVAALPLLCAGLAVQLLRRRGTGVTVGVVVALLTADLVVSNSGLAPMAPASFYRDAPPAIDVLRGDPGPLGRVWVESPRASGVRLVPTPEHQLERAARERAALIGYIGAAYRLDLAFNMDAGLSRPFLYGKLGMMVGNAPVREKLMLLGAAGVTHLVTHTALESPQLDLLAEIPGSTDRPQRVARNRLALPRVRHVPTLLPYEGDIEFMLAVQTHPDDLFQRVALVSLAELEHHGLQPSLLVPPDWSSPSRATGTATLVHDAGSELVLGTTGLGGFVVVNDSLVPGWSAEVDGRPAPLLRADYAFRAVPVPPGEHRVVLRYCPWDAGPEAPG